MKLPVGLASLFCALSVQAGELKDPELVYSLLSNAFPEAVEHAGGLSTSIDLKRISCAASNARQNGQLRVVASCNATTFDGKELIAKGDVRNLVFGLMNARLPIDQHSEPGTTYVSGADLECFRMECKSSNPATCENVPVEYSCSAK